MAKSRTDNPARAGALEVTSDLPEAMAVTEGELDMLESYLSDLVSEMLN